GPDNSLMVVAGFGAKPRGMVAVLNRKDGTIAHLLDRPEYNNVVWQAVFDPGNRYVVYGTEDGSLWRWEFAAKKQNQVLRIGDAATEKCNRTRLIAFTDDDHFLSVAMDGDVLRWDLVRPAEGPKRLGRFQLAEKEGLSLFQVVISRDKHWLAAVGEDR